jgi:hypothetical protein
MKVDEACKAKAIRLGMLIAAELFEQVNPASDVERINGDPGAGAMGAVIEYRDLIRKEAEKWRPDAITNTT